MPTSIQNQSRETPLVSVWIITYNQEKYLSKAIDSALRQKTDFPFEIVIGEDCSTDKTREVCLRYQREHPDKVRLVLHPQNMGLVRNFWVTLQACQGQYVAQLEGDDLWTDALKLQKQVDLLKSRPECSFSYHLFDHVDGDGNLLGQSKEPRNTEDLPPDCDTRMVIDAKWSPVQTLTLMFRRNAFTEMPEWVYTLPIFDWPLHFYLTRAGKGVFVNENMAAYRSHDEGVWSGTDHVKNSLRYYHFYRCILKAHPGEYDGYMAPRIRFHAREMLEECLCRGSVRTTAYRLWLYLRHHFPTAMDWRFCFSVFLQIAGFAWSQARIRIGRMKPGKG
jgi:glycosyltransferase involved in cell wall biosynthesis